MAADVLIRDVFGSRSFVERCSSRANWQACSDFILTGKHSAFLPPRWKCQCRGATRATVIETWRREGQWLMRAVNTFFSELQRGERRVIFFTRSPWYASSSRLLTCQRDKFLFCLFIKESNENVLCLKRICLPKRVSPNARTSKAEVNVTVN